MNGFSNTVKEVMDNRAENLVIFVKGSGFNLPVEHSPINFDKNHIIPN
jgi:hypothetical protein